MILDAIKYHNKIKIPNNIDDKTMLFSKIVRDADKLDIFYLFSISNELFKDDNEKYKKYFDYVNNHIDERIDKLC